MNIRKEQIFQDTLHDEYKHESFILFIREMLNNVNLVAPNKQLKTYSTFSAAVDYYYHIGNYVGEDQQKVALFSVCLKSDPNLENARSMQRNFVKSLIRDMGYKGALVAFFTSGDTKKWRFSLVRIDYEFSNGKLSEKLTPAKRYSYLVGKDEPCHTAMERLFPIFEDDSVNPSLDRLEEAFSVEAVTNDFFRQYREKYLELKEYLESNQQFVKEANEKGFDSEQFAKKLMGQIVFLYFIQKKGWLGVEAFPKMLTEKIYKNAFFRSGAKPKQIMPYVYKKYSDGNYYLDQKALMNLSEEDETFLSTLIKGNAWGTGPKDFMKRSFDDVVKKQGKNYFDDFLEPLFYTGLNENRGDNAFYPPSHRRIPFLNGGLFEEMDGYDWKNNNFEIPNELFSNEAEKDREADGILDIFNRYNFTMAEDEPMEREVAIDPEMLGKVFENLLDVKDRKSKGAFYTPREIVHYMCQESIINYLASKTNISESDIRKFVLYGEYFKDEDIQKTTDVDGKKVFDKTKKLEIPESIFSFEHNVNRLKEIDDLLANVKVVDPAVGSGAFPLGMLNEIVKARNTLTSYMAIEKNSRQRKDLYIERNPYRFKRETIRDCIFACDIEPSAVDITKLRLWLSLVIDDQIMEIDDVIMDSSTKPRELPNLDCNIICGNSLLDEFMGEKLITKSSALNNLGEYYQGTLYDESVYQTINEIIALQRKLYDEKDHVEKNSLKRQIQERYDNIILEQLKGTDKAEDNYYQAIQKPSRPFILWQLYFPRVFKENGGFDIVIGNPPYGAKISNTEKKIYQSKYLCTKTITGKQKGSTDTFSLFIEKGLNLIVEKGSVLTYIVPMSVTSSDSMTALHNIIEQCCDTVKISSYSNRPKQIFDAACIRTSIIQLSKTSTPMKHLYTTKLIRRTEENTIGNIIETLSFVDSFKLKSFGRYPKIGNDIEFNIIDKMIKTRKVLGDYEDNRSDVCVYYRKAGGRYFNVMTSYETGSSQEAPYYVMKKYHLVVGAILSTTLFWMYQQAYTDGLHIKNSELIGYPMPDLEKCDNGLLNQLAEVYQQYLDDIEKNVVIHQTSTYKVGSFKEYKIVKSKAYIDKLDDIVGKLYGLSDDEIEFVKNYEINVRMNEN